MPDDVVAAFRKYLFQDEPWKERARCRDPEINVDLFFPVRGSSQKEAKAICARCPVRAECNDYANRTNSTYGIWGGKIRHRWPHDKDEDEDNVA